MKTKRAEDRPNTIEEAVDDLSRAWDAFVDAVLLTRPFVWIEKLISVAERRHERKTRRVQ